MKCVNRHIHGVLVLISQLNHLLHDTVVRHTHKSAKASHAVVDMHNVVANLKLTDFLERESHLASARLLALKVIFVETVKYLMVGKEALTGSMVDKTTVDGTVDRLETDFARSVFWDLRPIVGVYLRKNILKTSYLLIAIGKDVYPIAFADKASQLIAKKVEILMEKRLLRCIETHNVTFGVSKRVAKFYASQLSDSPIELLAADYGMLPNLKRRIHTAIVKVGESRLDLLALLAHHVVVGLLLRQSLSREALFINHRHAVAHERQVTNHKQQIFRNKVGKRYIVRFLTVNLWHDVSAADLALRKLRLNIESSDTIDFVAKEVYAERIFRRIGKDVDNASSYGKLTRLVDIVRAAETKFEQALLQLRNVDHSPHGNTHHIVGEFVFRHNLLGQSLRISHDIERLRIVAGIRTETTQHLGTKNRIGCVLLVVLYGAAIGRREKQYALLAQHLHHVVIEITSLVHIVEDEKKRRLLLLSQSER